MATRWLKTRPGIVSRTADGAYGKYLRTRRVYVPGEGYKEMPIATPESKNVWGETYEDWKARLAAQDRANQAFAHQHPGAIYNEANRLAMGYSQPTVPGTEYPLLSKRHIPGFFRGGSLQDWMGQDWLARMQQLLDNLPAPFKNWLSNYPRLPQSTIPTPTVKYPAPGRPPVPGRPPAPGEPGYTNPFAWRRKNNSWW